MANSILQQIANPQVANIPGAFIQGQQAAQQHQLGQQKINLLQQQARQERAQEQQRQQRFSEVSDKNIMIDLSNDVNEALGMGPGETQDALLKTALSKAPEGSAPSAVLNDIISDPNPVSKQKKIRGVVERATQQGLIQGIPKATKTAEQIERGLLVDEGNLEVQRIKAAKVKADRVSKLKQATDELDALPEDSPYRESYKEYIANLTRGKQKFSQEVIDSNVQAVLSGQNAPKDVSKRGGLQAQVVSGVMAQDPSFNFVEADANAKYKQTQGNLLSRALIGGVQPLYDDLRKKGHSLKNTRIKMFNAVRNWFKEQTGDADVVAFNNLRDDVVAESERILLGTGVLSDSKYLRAVENLKTSNSPEQINAAIDQFEMVVAARLQALDDAPFEEHVTIKAKKTPTERGNGKIKFLGFE